MRNLGNLETPQGVSSRVQAGIYLRVNQAMPGLPPSITSEGYLSCGFVPGVVVSSPVHFSLMRRLAV